jgi:hypothetical protein
MGVCAGRNGSACVECNTSACDAMPGLYRTVCEQGSYADSTCGTCDRARLWYNDPSSYGLEDAGGLPLVVREAFNASQARVSRRWAPLGYNSTHVGQSVLRSVPEGCWLTCVNNYAWVDLVTGKPPLITAGSPPLVQKRYACVPCVSALMGGSLKRPLYSVWNYSRGGGRFGGCYTCPRNTDTIEGRDQMCESPPGFGQPRGKAVNVTVVLAGNTALVGGVPNVTVMSQRLPLIYPSDQVYFQCCNKDRQCRLFNKSDVDRNQASLSEGSAYAACTRQYAIGRRRALLQADNNNNGGDEEEAVEMQECFTSQYNTRRGDNNCYNCPIGTKFSHVLGWI